MCIFRICELFSHDIAANTITVCQRVYILKIYPRTKEIRIYPLKLERNRAFVFEVSIFSAHFFILGESMQKYTLAFKDEGALSL